MQDNLLYKKEMRKCCGYYCAMIAVVGIFFYSVIIVMESRYNNFLMYKM